MLLLLIAFFSWVLTVLAPCVLPLLPIVLGASAEDGNNRKIPLVIIASLSVSIILFSLLLKASTLLIDVPPSFWKTFSAWILITLWVITIFPNLWKQISTKIWFSSKSNQFLGKTQEKKWMIKYVFMGFALGPVFSSCSPTYALILAIILPAGFFIWILALISYTLWLALILFAIAVFWQKLIKSLRWASNPNWLFKKILWFIFILVGLAIFTWYDKKIEAAILEAWFINTTLFEQSIIDQLELDEISENTNTQQSEKSWEQCRKNTCDKESKWSLTFLSPENILDQSESKIISEKWFPAPEFSGLSDWINSDWYQSITQLRWKVVMIDFWTLWCINCINTHSDTNKLYSEFKDQGFEIIGLHAPEFAYEKKVENVLKAVEDFWIEFPVALDNEFTTWNRYNNKYWPAFYIIDKQGDIRFTHFGEGWYEKKRQAIRELLSESI